MIVTGKAVSAERALQIGLVDELCDADLDAHALVLARHAAHAETASRVLTARTLALSKHDNETIAPWMATQIGRALLREMVCKSVWSSQVDDSRNNRQTIQQSKS